MRSRRTWNGTSRIRLIVMFLVVLLPPAVTLIGLGIRLLQQDQIIEARREVESRDAAAEMVVRSLGQSLAEIENSAVTSLPEGVLRIRVAPGGVQLEPADRVLWSTQDAGFHQALSEPFIQAEAAEYQGRPEAALATYRELARSNDATVRAGALLRVARVAQNQHDLKQALDAYRSLAEVRGVTLIDQPADFLARRSICRLLTDSGRTTEAQTAAHALETDLLSNRWMLEGDVWELAAHEIEQWIGRPLAITAHRKTLSLAADWVLQNWRAGALSGAAKRTIQLEDGPVTLTWRVQANQLEAIAFAPDVIEAWLEKARPENAARVSLVSDSGELLSGPPPDSSARLVKRAVADTGLPWTVVLSPSGDSRSASDLAARRRLLGWGLAAIVLLLAGGSYFLWRVIERELAVARLQTEFVAAVSHEFRTPLTSLRHITELLEEDDGLPSGPEQERLKTFYSALGRNTERLHRLVESLLDFSRMETGRKPWRLEPTDAVVLAEGVASEFQKEVQSRGVRVEFAAEYSGTLLLRADTEALGHALWNLLDNAVKYSPEPGSVHVSVGRKPNGIVIAVKDEGIGIPPQEQRNIFRKFVRGEQAGKLGIKGTGLGLAIVAHIVEAHGGAIELESEEGKGSTFRLVLPAEA
jgi:signal transduction histidine kinase